MLLRFDIPISPPPFLGLGYYLSCCVNPLVYCAMSRRFRRAFANVLFSCAKGAGGTSWNSAAAAAAGVCVRTGCLDGTAWPAGRRRAGGKFGQGQETQGKEGRRCAVSRLANLLWGRRKSQDSRNRGNRIGHNLPPVPSKLCRLAGRVVGRNCSAGRRLKTTRKEEEDQENTVFWLVRLLILALAQLNTKSLPTKPSSILCPFHV